MTVLQSRKDCAGFSMAVEPGWDMFFDTSPFPPSISEFAPAWEPIKLWSGHRQAGASDWAAALHEPRRPQRLGIKDGYRTTLLGGHA